ncbi:MAG TPA: Fic family protein [Acidimicrobiales bacterium]|nr:Fic family protein [Acidimicrobiales bacterium]
MAESVEKGVAKLVERTWTPADLTGLPRRDRQGCRYSAYIPDRLVGRELFLSGTTAADVSDAEAALAGFDNQVSSLVDTEALARLLLRAEAVASSHIEGLVVGGRRLLRAEAAGALGETAVDVTTAEVLGNIDAMNFAIQQLAGAVTIEGILEIHRLLLASTPQKHLAGRLRDAQNWIGGSSYNPCSAAFVPPPEGDVEDLMADLCAFINDDTLSPVAQAAVVHAQFETIHPFVDGNGRTGRALVHVVLRRRGLTTKAVPPISLILATRAEDYVAGLTSFRYLGSPDQPAAVDGVNHWISTFAAATTRAAVDAGDFEERIDALKATWRDRLGGVRAGSATAELVERLPGTPIVTVQGVAEMLGRSVTSIGEAIDRFAEAGILTQITTGRRNRAWEASEVVDAFTDFERALASPTGGTSSAKPARPVPARRQRKKP